MSSVKFFSSTSILILIFSWLSNKVDHSTATSPVIRQSKVRCETEDGTCYCPEDPLTRRYPDFSDPSCQNYYLCHLGRAFKWRCPIRSVFHPDKNECMPRERVPESICKLPVPCPPFINRYVEDPEDCTKYYLCFYQRPLLYACPPDNYFDPEKEMCVHDTLTADQCRTVAEDNFQADKSESQLNPEKTSLALSKAQAIIAEHNIKSKPRPKPLPAKPKDDWVAFAYPLGKFLRGRD